MAAKRDGLFPSASIGRTQGIRYREENTSQDSLTAHPLLSSPVAATSDATRHLPYTPRQRVTTPSPATGTFTQAAVSVSTPQHGATSKLQLQNLKAAAQAINLGSNTLGWAIVEKLVAEGDRKEWEDIWSALTTSKATLLLPIEPATDIETITPDLVRDHVAFCNGSANNSAPLITLSGLRGSISADRLTFRSDIATNSTLFQSLLAPSTRASTLPLLPPLPVPIVHPLPYIYPSFVLPAYAPQLPFPPRAHPTSPPAKTTTTNSPTTAPHSRLSNPFASLFGAPRQPPSQPPVSLPPSEDIESDRSAIEIPAFAIDTRISKKTVCKDISKAIKAEIKEALNGVPSWVIERVQSFTAHLHPFPKASRKSRAGSLTNSSATLTTPTTQLTPDLTSPQAASGSFQEFYELLEADLRAGGTPFIGRRKEDQKNSNDNTENVKWEREQAENDAKTRVTLGAVEKVICTVFYDRIYRPATSDDASHDEALASRVAALNMLDLTFEHLGVDVGSGTVAVNAVVKTCGETLQRLENPQKRSPAEKAAVLVAAHNVIVDGLSRLPPVRLKPDSETIHDDRTASMPPSKSESSVTDTVANKEASTGVLSPPPESTAQPENSAETLVTQSPQKQHVDASHEPPLGSPPTPTPVASDILLPFIIFSVVKANPTQLISHLLYVQRYRSRNTQGEEAFCLINLLAAAEFLENVDLGALGLGDSDKVLSVADLDPLPLAHSSDPSSPTSPKSASARLRGRVNQQVEELAGSANKVISGVVDSSFLALRGLLSSTNPPGSPDVSVQAPWNFQRPGFGLLRRGSGFSIASVASSLPALPSLPRAAAPRRVTDGTDGENGQMMIDVSSRPLSRADGHSDDEHTTSSDDDQPHQAAEETSSDSDDPNAIGGRGDKSDLRSIKSFGSMISRDSRERRRKEETRERLSISDRLAGLSRSPPSGKLPLRKLSPPSSRRTSLLSAPPLNTLQAFARPDSPLPSSRPSSPPHIHPLHQQRIAPPNSRFLNCTENDLRIGEVADLLREYRRVVEGLRALGGFEN